MTPIPSSQPWAEGIFPDGRRRLRSGRRGALPPLRRPEAAAARLPTTPFLLCPPPPPAQAARARARARALGSARRLPAPRRAGEGLRTVRIQNGGAPRPPTRLEAARCGPADPGPRERVSPRPAALRLRQPKERGPGRLGCGTGWPGEARAGNCAKGSPRCPLPSRPSSPTVAEMSVCPSWVPSTSNRSKTRQLLPTLFTCPPCPHSAFPRPRVLISCVPNPQHLCHSPRIGK